MKSFLKDGAVGAALVALLLFLATPLWASQNDLLQFSSVKSTRGASSLLLDITNAGDRLVTVGARGHVLYSDDKGESWLQAEVPVSITLTAVEFVGAKLGWATGHDGVILHSLDGGASWEVQFDGNKANELILATVEKNNKAKIAKLQALPASERDEFALEDLQYAIEDAQIAVEEGAWKPFLDLWFKNEREGFVVGAYGMLFRTVDGGKSWTCWSDRMDNPEGLHLNAIGKAKDLLMISGESGTLYRSLDEGMTWETLESPYYGSYFGVISDQNQETVYVTGLRGNAYKSNDLGASWTKVETGLGGPINGGRLMDDGSMLLLSSTVLQGDGYVFNALNVQPGLYSGVALNGNGTAVAVGVTGVKRFSIKTGNN